MSNTQHPEALMLADDLDGDWTTIKHMRDAAAELRRQQARIEELEEPTVCNRRGRCGAAAQAGRVSK